MEKLHEYKLILRVSFKNKQEKLGGVRNLERPNVEWPIFQNYKIANVKS